MKLGGLVCVKETSKGSGQAHWLAGCLSVVFEWVLW
jgi:hypothetical protein